MITPPSIETVRIPKVLSDEVAMIHAKTLFNMEKDSLTKEWGKEGSNEYEYNKSKWLEIKVKSIQMDYRIAVHLGTNY